MERERAGGNPSGSSFIQKWRGRTAYREPLKRIAAALSRGEESGASQPAQGLFTSTDGLLPP